MTTISCEVMRAGAAMPRATINGQQFIECGVMRAGARTPDAKIGSGAQVLNVKSWTPDQDDVEVPHGHTVKVNAEAINTEEKNILYDEGADYLATGEFYQTKPVGEGVQLGTSSPSIDFEDYAVDTNLIDVSHPNEWINRSPYNGMTIRDDIPGESENQYVKCQYYNQNSMCSLEDAGVLNSGIIRTRFRFETTGPILVFFLTTGSGTALRGHGIQVSQGSVWTGLYRLNHSDYWYGLGSHNLGFTPASDVWYWMEIKFENRDTDIVAWWKVWAEGDSEPSAYQHGKTDASYIQDGVIGIAMKNGVDNTIKYFDDFSIDPIPASHYSDGTWEDSQDVSLVEHFSHGVISWDEVTPTDTTAVVKARWRDTDAWAVQTSGERITGIDLGDDMRAGATKDTVSLRIELATTVATSTPSVANLRVYFEPLDRDQVEIVVHGAANTLAANTLLDWGMAWLRPAASEPYVEVLDWSDLWFQTVKRWMARDKQTVAATLEYWGNLIESITFEAEASKYRHGYEPCEWVVPALVMASGPTLYEWTALTEWYPMGHNFTWNIIDKGQAIHADYRWLVGHAQLDDHPLSFLLAVPNITDHPLSVLARAYARNDHPLSMLIQGWQRDDHPLSFLVGIWTINDQPVSMLAAIEYLNDHPLSWLVYGVSREGMIEVNIIDDDTWLELVSLGYTRS